MSILDKTDNAISTAEKKAGQVVQTVKDGASNLAVGVGSAVKYGISEAKQHNTSIKQKRSARRALPEMANASDAFNRKLFSYADFDFLIGYLKDSGLATCDNIYTRNTLVEYAAQATGEALDTRSVGYLTRLYFAILRLCARRRKGLLAYINVNGNKAKKLLTWETFLEYANFADPQNVDNIWLPVSDLFPRLRKVSKRTQKAMLEKQAVELESQASNSSEDTIGTELNDSTKMFKKSSVNYAEIVVSLYNRIAARTQEVAITKENSFDALILFGTYLHCGQKTFADINALLSAVQSYLEEHIPGVGLKNLAEFCSGVYLRLFRQFWSMPEGSGNRNEELKQVVADTYAIDLASSSDYIKVFETVRFIFENEITQLKNGADYSIPSDLPQDIQQELKDSYKHKFEDMYTQLAKDASKLSIEENNLADILMCLVIHAKKKLPSLQLEQYSALAVGLFSESGLNADTLRAHLVATSSDFFSALKYSMGIHSTSSSSENKSTLCQIILQMVEKYLGIIVSKSEQGVQALKEAFNAYIAKQSNQSISQKSAMDSDLFDN